MDINTININKYDIILIKKSDNRHWLSFVKKAVKYKECFCIYSYDETFLENLKNSTINNGTPITIDRDEDFEFVKKRATKEEWKKIKQMYEIL